MKMFGAHVSTEGGVPVAPGNAQKIGATAFALFTKNQRQWTAAPAEPATADAFKAALADNGFAPSAVVAHAGYLINLGNPTAAMLEKSFASLMDELGRCEALGIPCLNLHPGSHLGQTDDETCMRQIAAQVNRALAGSRGVTILLESTAGQGSHVGHRFEHLARIIEQVNDKSRAGICFDTCHSFAAGYDIRTKATFDRTVQELDRVVGLKYLKAVHLNDSVGGLGSRKDRHAHLGEGEIGETAFKLLAADPRFDGIPIILETPDEERWSGEIAKLAKWAVKGAKAAGKR